MSEINGVADNTPVQSFQARKTVSRKMAVMQMSFMGVVKVVLGLMGNVIVAMAFGTTEFADSYHIGISLPRILLYLCGLDVMRGVIVTVFSKLDVTKQEHPLEVFSSIITLLFFLSVIVALGGIFLAPWLVNLLAPEVNAFTTRLTVNITMITMPSVIFMMMGAISSAVMIAYHEYLKSHVYEILSRLILVAAAVIVLFTHNVYILASGFTLAPLLASLLSLKLLASCGIKYRPSLRLSPVVKSMLFQSVPLWVGIIALYAVDIIQKRYASAFGIGAIASLTYARTVFAVVTTVVSIPLFRALSPQISRNVAMGDFDKESRLFWSCFRQGTCLALVLTAIVFMVPKSVVSVVFARGQFGAEAVSRTSFLLAWMGIAIWGNIISYQAIAVILAHKKSYLVMILDIITNLTLYFLLVLLVESYGLGSIAMAFGISQLVRGILAVGMTMYLLQFRHYGLFRWLGRFALTSALSIATLKTFLMFFHIESVKFWPNLLSLILASIIICITFGFCGYFMALEEVIAFTKYVKSIFLRHRNVGH